MGILLNRMKMSEKIEIVIEGEMAWKLKKLSEAWGTTPEQAFQRILSDFYERLHRSKT